MWPLGFILAGAYYYGLQTQKSDVYEAELDQAGQVRGAAAPVARQHMGANWAHAWSPGGKRLAYVSQPSLPYWLPDARVVIRELASGAERELRSEVSQLWLLHWSPEGRSLAATGTGRALRTGAWAMDAETGETKMLVAGTNPRVQFHEAAWTSDGKTLLYRARERGNEPAPLAAREADGRGKVLAPSVYRFCLSPDGRRLAYSSFDDGEGPSGADGGEAAKKRWNYQFLHGRCRLYKMVGKVSHLEGLRRKPPEES